ncbi:uncharacterized protein LOC110448487 [Mizuhopecten yessoensis]|uniref:Uncharacterized protein n=1 Tax=Mizuhopecten yessoensis TaxID=6573 RepID=A0A210QT71_MIZYE|nr:uncharacterized protein LOC110448487 [Mizuhopecten yessoensis]OWF51900.1 hypothetical protein KP79_PYT20722 [Mizuhopecten yessoensis]
MDSSKVLTTVCVLAIIMGSVTSQSCTETYPCFTKLGTFVDGFNDLKSVLKSGKKADVGGNVLDDVKDILPGNTLDELSSRMEQFTSCIFDVFKSCGNETTSLIKSIRKQIQSAPPPQNSSGHLQKEPGSLQTVYAHSLAGAVDTVNDVVDGLGNGYEYNYSSGCVKLESWPLLGVIAVLISSGLKQIQQ